MNGDQPNIGDTPRPGARRDAIHFAVAPAVAAHDLVRGSRVGFVGESSMVGSTNPGKEIGVVDPFRRYDVPAGETFWLMLFPNTITGIRHTWSHPAFADEDVPGTTKANTEQRQKAASFLIELAAELKMPYAELVEILRQCNGGIDVHVLPFYTPDRLCDEYDRRHMWRCWEIVSGERAKDLNAYVFRCSC
jgi:hypothetical protein